MGKQPFAMNPIGTAGNSHKAVRFQPKSLGRLWPMSSRSADTQNCRSNQNPAIRTSALIEQLARDLKHEFPDRKGFSPRNLGYMKAFAAAWPDELILQQAAAKLPWFHLCTLLDKVDDQVVREWYARAYLDYDWSRNVLVHQIESRLHERRDLAKPIGVAEYTVAPKASLPTVARIPGSNRGLRHSNASRLARRLAYTNSGGLIRCGGHLVGNLVGCASAILLWRSRRPSRRRMSSVF